MFFPHFRFFWPLFLVIWGVLSLVSPFFRRLKTLDGIIKRQRVHESGLQLAKPTEVQHLSGGGVERATEELKSFGFEEVGDYVSFSAEGKNSSLHSFPPIASPNTPDVPPSPVETAGFLRIFLHEREKCVAKLMVSTITPIATGRSTTSFVRAIISFADAPDGRAIWSYATTDTAEDPKKHAVKALWRSPRAIFSRSPNTATSELWRVHLQRRAQVAEVAGLQWNRATLREALEAETRAKQNMLACFEKMTPLKMAWLLNRYKREKNQTEWLGELRGKLPPLSP